MDQEVHATAGREAGATFPQLLNHAVSVLAAKLQEAGPSTPRRFAQDDKRGDAGPSTPLRFAQDDRHFCLIGMTELLDECAEFNEALSA